MDNKNNTVILKVAASSNPSSVAGSIVKNISENNKVIIQSIGAGAVNQTVKALAIARGYTSLKGNDLYFKVGFSDIEINNEKRTALKFFVMVE